MRYIISPAVVQDKDVMVLLPDRWDDYSYKTSFDVKYIDKTGTEIDLGTIKIGKEGFEPGWIKEHLEWTFEQLPSDFFTLAVGRKLSEGQRN